MKEIKICYNHQDEEQTPLIWTFAFPGAEYWCPYCGGRTGMLGGGEDIESTKELEVRHRDYKKRSKKYLVANSKLFCSELLWRGKWISPRDLTPRVREKLRETAKSWEYKG